MIKKTNYNGLIYYTDSYIKTVQDKLLETLFIFDGICKDNNIEYFLDGGTAIEALRDGKIAAWDDDIDVSMLKPDFNRLRNILKYERKKYFFTDPSEVNHCCGYFGIKGKYFLTYGKKRRGLSPIKIDIRPLNIIPNNTEEKKYNRVLRELANYLIFKECDSHYKAKAKELYINIFEGSPNCFFKFYNDEYGLYKDKTNSLIVHPYLRYSNENFYYFSDFFPLKRVSFHNKLFSVPNKDSFLRDYYGDYMDYPDIETRKPESTGLYYSEEYEYYYKRFEENKSLKQPVFSIERMQWIMHVLFELKKVNQ